MKKVKIPDRKEARAQYDRCRSHYTVVLRKIQRRIRDLLLRNEIEATVKYRLKRFEAYYKKLIKYNSTAQRQLRVNDVLGIRIVCPFLEDIDSIAKLVHDHFTVIEVERKGMRHSLDEFAYDSVHLLVEIPYSLSSSLPCMRKVCEIQLRTILQDAWAEVEHELIYKADYSPLNEPIKRKLASLNAILTLSDIVFQEIRNYQRELKELGEMRRESLHEKIAEEEISLISRVEKLPPMESVQLKMPRNPKNRLEKLIFEALDAHNQHRYDQAIQAYSALLNMKVDPRVRSIIYNHRGMAYFVKSEYRKSIRDFTRAIDYNADNFRAYINRGLAYRMLERYERALDDFNRSLQISALHVEGYYGRALAYLDLHDYLRALEDCQEALNIKSDFIPAQRLRHVIESKLYNR